MNATPRVHFEELDWLDYAQGEAAPRLAAEMQHHAANCAECRERLESMRRLAAGLPFAGELLEGESRAIEAERAPFDVESVARAARATVEAAPRDFDAHRRELLDAFSSSEGAGYRWTAPSYEAARVAGRELLRSDVPLAGRIARAALGALENDPGRQEIGADGVEGVLRTVAAYVLYTEGESERALEELEKARPAIELLSRVPEDDLAFWSYVSALALRDIGRAEAALEALDVAEKLAQILDDFPRQARCRIVRAAILADLGKPEESIAIHETLLAREGELEDARLLGMIYNNLGADLLDTDRTDDARRFFARAAEIFRKTGEQVRMLRIRAGLATIAAREGRYQDSLDTALELREHFRSKNLGWDEVHTEIRIVEALLRLGRSAEAVETCRRLLPRIEELGLSREAARAVAFLTEAELDLDRIRKVRQFFGRAERNPNPRWSAA